MAIDALGKIEDGIKPQPHREHSGLFRFTAKFRQDCGSITLLTLGFFLLALSSIFLLTNLASIGVAKASLSHISELAAQRGLQELDESRYYNSSFSHRMADILRSRSYELDVNSPAIYSASTTVIPIDCSHAKARVLEELDLWKESPESFSRPEMLSVELISFQCDGSTVRIHTKSMIKLPFTLPFAGSEYCEIYAVAEAKSVKDL